MANFSGVQIGDRSRRHPNGGWDGGRGENVIRANRHCTAARGAKKIVGRAMNSTPHSRAAIACAAPPGCPFIGTTGRAR
jgi:hypothetical protein